MPEGPPVIPSEEPISRERIGVVNRCISSVHIIDVLRDAKTANDACSLQAAMDVLPKLFQIMGLDQCEIDFAMNLISKAVQTTATKLIPTTPRVLSTDPGIAKLQQLFDPTASTTEAQNDVLDEYKRMFEVISGANVVLRGVYLSLKPLIDLVPAGEDVLYYNYAVSECMAHYELCHANLDAYSTCARGFAGSFDDTPPSNRFKFLDYRLSTGKLFSHFKGENQIFLRNDDHMRNLFVCELVGPIIQLCQLLAEALPIENPREYQNLVNRNGNTSAILASSLQVLTMLLKAIGITYSHIPLYSPIGDVPQSVRKTCLNQYRVGHVHLLGPGTTTSRVLRVERPIFLNEKGEQLGGRCRVYHT